MQRERPQSYVRECPIDLSKESSKVMFEHNLLSQLAAPEDKLYEKRRQLLMRSAKRPFKRSNLVQQKCGRNGEGDTDTISTASLSFSSSSSSISPPRTNSPLSKRRKGNRSHRLKTNKRRMVSFDAKYNQTILVPSHRDLDQLERRSYYFQRDEYVRIRRNIQRTIEFLQSPADHSSSFNPFDNVNSFGIKTGEEHCVRGLECVAEEAVNDFKKRIQRTSKAAVFRWQENHRRRIVDKLISAQSSQQMCVALSKEYRKYTSQCEEIARRWGQFDAMDAGYDPVLSSSIVVNCGTTESQANDESSISEGIAVVERPIDNNASLSSLSYDGDDGEDEKEGCDHFNARDSVNAFDSLPGGLFNY